MQVSKQVNPLHFSDDFRVDVWHVFVLFLSSDLPVAAGAARRAPIRLRFAMPIRDARNAACPRDAERGRMAGMVNPSETYTAWSIGEGAHEVTGLKPMLNPEEQVALLKAKGVSFERCGEEQAADALARRGTFVHLASCRRLFQKHASGDDRGKYVRLDFADLLDGVALDDELRKAFLAVSQDVERLAKTSMVTRASRLDDEDGYGIVADFMRAQQRRYRSYIERDLSSRMSAGIVGDVYTGRIIGHYRDAMPVWAFLEVVTFGTALAFCLFCSERWDDAVMREEHYILKGVKAVRNCCSHGSCIVNGMDGSNECDYALSSLVYDWLAEKGVGNSKTRRAKLRNRRMQQLLETLVMFDRLGGPALCPRSTALLEGLRASLLGTCESYGVQNGFVSYLRFLANLIDKALG